MIIIKVKDGAVFRMLDSSLISDVSVNREESKIGEITFTYPLSDSKSDLLTGNAEIQLYESDGVNTVFVDGGYIIGEPSNSYLSDTPTKVVRAVNYLDEFRREQTVPNIAYIDELYTDILDQTFPKTFLKSNETWDSTVEPTTATMTTIVSLQKPIQLFSLVKEQIGYSFRYTGDEINPRKIEFGKFGQHSGVKIRANPKSNLEIGDNILVIDGNLIEEIDYSKIVNHVQVLGGGDGVNQVTLRDVDPALVTELGYPIEVDADIPNDDTTYDSAVFTEASTAPNNSTAYYIKDDTSIASYGVNKNAITVKNNIPLPGSGDIYTDTDRIRAANETYRSAVQYLEKNKDKKIFYSFTCLGKTLNFNVGDLINLKYKGEIKRVDKTTGNFTTRTLIDVDKDFYVTSIDMQYEDPISNLKSYSLEISNTVDGRQTVADVLADNIQKVQSSARVRNGSVSPSFAHYKDSLDSTIPASFLFRIPKETVYVNRLELKLNVRKFRAYSKATAGGGAISTTTASGGGTVSTSSSNTAHNHAMFIRSQGGSVTYPLGVSLQAGSPNLCGSRNFVLVIDSSSGVGSPGGPYSDAIVTDCTDDPHHHTVPVPSHTHNFSLPSHSHAIQYGIYENPSPFSGVKLLIDGVDYAPELGTWNSIGYKPSGSAVYDLMKAASNLGVINSLIAPGDHTFEIQCASGLVSIEMFLYYQFYLSSR